MKIKTSDRCATGIRARRRIFIKAGVVVCAWLALTGCRLSSPDSTISRSLPDLSLFKDKLPDSAKENEPAKELDDVQLAKRAARNCPVFRVWPATKVLNVTAPGMENNRLAVIYSAQINRTARQCMRLPGKLFMRLGFEGRVLLGPKGKPMAMTLPVKIHLTNKNRKVLRTDRLTLKARIPAGETEATFRHVVDQYPIELPEGSKPADFKVFVEFGKSGRRG